MGTPEDLCSPKCRRRWVYSHVKLSRGHEYPFKAYPIQASKLMDLLHSKLSHLIKEQRFLEFELDWHGFELQI